MISVCGKIKRKWLSWKGRRAGKRYNRLFKQKGSRNLDRNKEIYYIIRRYPKGAGFFSNYLCVLSHMAYAREMKYIPVVDMERYPTLYSEESLIKGTKNAWEYYFRQVDDLSLKKAYRSRNYILSESEFQREGMRHLTDVYFFPLEDGVEFYYGLSSQIRFERDLEKELEDKREKLQMKKKKTLGIHIRGTDMSSGEHTDHPQSLQVRDYIEMAERFLAEDDEISQIFLATDEEKAENAFRDRFGSRVCVSDAYRAKGDTGVGLHCAEDDQRKNHHYLLGKEVVEDAYLLAKCDSLLCGFSNVASVAIIWNHNQYEKIGVLCRKEYGERLAEEIAKRENINRARYIIKAI